MKKYLLLLSLLFTSLSATAAPISLSYDITDLGSSYQYDFKLTLDNNDNSWVSGQGWGWIVFGDAMLSASPLTDWVGDVSSLSGSPWTFFGTSSGYNNGPTLGGVFSLWTPTSIGDYVSWSGTSSAYLGQGDLLWSSLVPVSTQILFEVAQMEGVSEVPVPAAVWLSAPALLSLMGLRRKAKQA